MPIHATRGMIAFEIGDKRHSLTAPLPDRNADEFRYTAAQEEVYEQAVRQRWRTLIVKATLEAVEVGITT